MTEEELKEYLDRLEKVNNAIDAFKAEIRDLENERRKIIFEIERRKTHE